MKWLYAWYVCRKCNTWKNHDMNRIKLPYNMEETQRKRYWSSICDSCKITVLKENELELIHKLEEEREELIDKIAIINGHLTNIKYL